MKVHIEKENINKISVKMLPREHKIVYTFIKKNTVVEYEKLLKKFKNYDIKSIIDDLFMTYLVYYVDDENKIIDGREVIKNDI